MKRSTLPREPYRGGQICGYQMAYGMPWSEFCPDRKAKGLRACAMHDRELRDEYGTVRWADGNATGDPDEPLELQWEPHEGDDPVEPTDEEREQYGRFLGKPVTD